jgi:hypothetical protein
VHVQQTVPALSSRVAQVLSVPQKPEQAPQLKACCCVSSSGLSCEPLWQPEDMTRASKAALAR